VRKEIMLTQINSKYKSAVVVEDLEEQIKIISYGKIPYAIFIAIDTLLYVKQF
jgi:hypothetical protein